MKTAKVIDIRAVREYTGERKTTWYFTVEMDNGDKGQISRDTEDGLKVGDTVTYEMYTTGRYATLKEAKPTWQGLRGKAGPSHALTALTLATQIAVANIAASGSTQTMNGDLTKRITGLADGLNKCLKENDK